MIHFDFARVEEYIWMSRVGNVYLTTYVCQVAIKDSDSNVVTSIKSPVCENSDFGLYGVSVLALIIQ